MRTRNVVIVIVATVGGLLLAAVGGVVYLIYTLTYDPTLDRFAKVKDGMTLQQVIRIMGREPSFDQQEPNGSLMYGWSHTEDTQAVIVYTRDGQTVRKQPFTDTGPRVLPDMTAPRRHIVRSPDLSAPATTAPATGPG